LTACGGGARQDASEPSGTFPVDVTTATFPSSQHLSQHTHLRIAVRNAGSKTIPDVAVTITNPKWGTSVEAFGTYLNMPGLASHSRPVWIVDRPPGPCDYSCQNGGLGGAVTAYPNTWAMGPLRPGATATFEWSLTAVQSGTYVVQYQVAAGLNGKAKAQASSGAKPIGRFTVTISNAAEQSYVNNQGAIVKGP
jgi:hypothetical protein